MKKNNLILIGSNLITFFVSWLIFSRLNENAATVNGGEGIYDPAPLFSSRGADDGSREARSQSKLVNDRAQGKGAENDTANFIYVNDAGDHLSSQIKTDCDLTDEQFQKAQLAMSHYWGEMGKRASERLMLDQEATDSALDRAKVYRLSAMPEEDRNALAAELRQQLDHIKAGQLGDKIIGGLGGSSAFGRLGSNDVVFRVTPQKVISTDANGNIISESISTEDYSVSYSLIDPKTGQKTGSGISTASELSDSYGNLFELPGR